MIFGYFLEHFKERRIEGDAKEDPGCHSDRFFNEFYERLLNCGVKVFPSKY